MNDILGLAGQPALVVGGGYGIGRATATILANAGARVAVADVDADRADAVTQEVGGYSVVGDVTTEEGAKHVVDAAHAALGGLTRLANIVGLADFRPFVDTEPAQWEAQLRINLYQHMMVCHAPAVTCLPKAGVRLRWSRR